MAVAAALPTRTLVESGFIDRLRAIATHPAARGLADDAAVLGDLVFTHDMIVEGVHFLPDDPPADIAWKLAAVNLSDLAAKGAVPVGCLFGAGLTRDEVWNTAFVAGLEAVFAQYAMPLLGGDTVAMPVNAPRTLGLTAIGRATIAPPRSGARAGDALWVTGTIGDAGLGLRILSGILPQPEGGGIAAYRRPMPLLAEGRALAPLVSAMMDVSDGLLIDAQRMAAASGLAIAIDLDAIPLSPAVRAAMTVLEAATAGDDYQLLFACAPDLPPPVAATRIGRFTAGAGVSLASAGRPVALPERLGWLHG